MADNGARSARSLITPMLFFSCFCMLAGDILFGYDTASFGGILANPGFIRQFGAYDPVAHEYAISSLNTSLLSSLAFIGKFIGCLIAGTLIERFGHRMVFYGLSMLSIIGVIIEISVMSSGSGGGHLAQFIIGRIIVYISVGLVEVCVTTYQSEIVPPQFRGLVVVSLQLFLNIGQIIATTVNKAYSTYTTPEGWKTVTGLQFIFPVLIITFTVFIPSSPRWLLSKDRADEAVAALRKLRPKKDYESGACAAEIQAIRDALREEVHKGPWSDLVRGKNLRRTGIVFVYYFFQQTTGQAFVSTYQTVFYKNNGFAENAFVYPIINSCLSTFSVLPGMYLVDKFGRRFSLSLSFTMQAFWIMLLAGLGTISQRSNSENNTIVAAFMLYAFSYNMGGASIPYLLGTEIPNASIREKTQSLGASWNVLWAFATNFSIPYLIDDLDFGVGWVFGGLSLLALAFTFLCLPETKGRALEEIDAIFEVRFNPFRPHHVPYSDAELRVGQVAAGKGDAIQRDEKSLEATKSESVST